MSQDTNCMDDIFDVTEGITVVMCEECNDLLWSNVNEVDEDDEWALACIDDKVVNVHSATAISKEMYEAEWCPDYYVVTCFCCENNVEKTMDGFFVELDAYGIIEIDDTFGGCVIQTKFECEESGDCWYLD